MRPITRIAGIAYFSIIVVSLLNFAFLGSKTSTAETARAHLGLFRAGLAIDLAMFAAVAVLAWALYVILREVDARLALLGLVFRLMEATLGLVAVIIGLTVAGPIEPALATTALAARAVTYDVLLVFLCLGTLTFCWLFLKSGLLPRWLAQLGLAAFALMLVGSLASLFIPGASELARMTYVPGTVFEIGAGLTLWLRPTAALVEVPS
jgi:hypothetical protein